MKKIYKIESKGSLFQVILSRGAYSDYREVFRVFATNSADEAWALVKAWARNGGIGETYSKGLIFNGEKFFFGKGKEDEDMSWESDYGDSFDVRISRLEVVYVNSLK